MDAKSEKSLLEQLRQRLCTDEELAAQLREGDADALTVLFNQHSIAVFGIAQRILGDAAEAEDAVQQIFLDVFRSIGQFKPEKGGFRAWLLIFAYHRSFNARRALCARRFFDTEPLEEEQPEIYSQTAGVRTLSYPEMRVLVEQALRSIPPRERRAIELVYYGGLTAEEVSTRTGETVRVARHNLYRGLDKLRRILCDAPTSCAMAEKAGPQ